MASIDLERTYGALLMGGLLAFGFSGMVTAQCIVYFKMYPEDSLFKKTMVAFVWVLDLVHSMLICAALFYWFIFFFGKLDGLKAYPWSIPASFFVTGMQTLITQAFFVHKIHRSSGSNWWVSSPIIFMIFARISVVTFAAEKMLISKTFHAFFQGKFTWSFTTGLCLSAGTDLLIAGWLFYYLRRFRRRMGSSTMVTVVDSLTKYTLESGFLTCFTTTATLVTWLKLNGTLVALGLHFLLAKLYINSLLAALNTRKELRDMREQTQEESLPPPVFSPADFESIRPRHPAAIVNPLDVYLSPRPKPKIEIKIQKHTSDSLGTLSDMMYPRTAPIRRPTLLEWRSGSYRSVTTMNSNSSDTSG